MDQAAPALRQRFQFLDLFRGAFTLLMIEGHTLRSLLDASGKASAFFQYQELIHNLPGPAFLFASGVSFGMAVFSQWDEYAGWSRRMRRRLSRILLVAVLGYALNLTYFSLGRTLEESTPDQLAFLASMNILPCIAWSALLLQLWVLILPSRQWFVPICSAAAAGVALATPFVWAATPPLPKWLGPNLGGYGGAVFPLFPYTGFLLAGAAWGYLYRRACAERGEAAFLRRTRRIAAWALLGSLLAAFLPLPAIYSDFWFTGPPFFSLRVAVLVLLAIGFRATESWLVPRLDLLALLGRESLLAYVAHLIVIYGSAWNPERNLVKLLGPALPGGEVAAILLGLTVAVTALCWAWERTKGQESWRAWGVRWILGGYFAYSFVAG